jgi:ubiquinone/menaquinone biosynthesis C-methylase UbiE
MFMSPRSWPRPLLGALAVAMLCCPVTAFAQRDEAEREKVERVADILAALGAQDGRKIADIGAADGFYALRIARAVAPSGRSYAIDIDSKSLEKLRERATLDAISNVEIILSEPADPKLPPGELDAVLIRNAYHEMTEYQSVLAGVARGLKPGGTLIVIESLHERIRTKTRAEQVKEHEIAPELVEAELRDAGFEIVERQEPFTTFTRGTPGGFWLIRARRP